MLLLNSEHVSFVISVFIPTNKYLSRYLSNNYPELGTFNTSVHTSGWSNVLHFSIYIERVVPNYNQATFLMINSKTNLTSIIAIWTLDLDPLRWKKNQNLRG